MTVHDLYRVTFEDSMVGLLVAYTWPGFLAGLAAALKRLGRPVQSQWAANFGVALGFGVLLVEVLGLTYAWGVLEVNPIATTPIALLLVGPTSVVAGFVAEHLVHPGIQPEIRAKLRGVMLNAVAIGVVLFLMARMRFWLALWTSLPGFLLFVGLMVGFFYWVLSSPIRDGD